MLGDSSKSQRKTKAEEVSGGSYILFLILILLIMGNQNTFNNHFSMLSKQLNGINSIFTNFARTAEGLKGLFQSDKKNNASDLF